MRILVTGGTGFIGQKLCSSFKAKGYEVTVLTRDPKNAIRRLPDKAFRFIKHLDEIDSGEHFDVVVNLAGAPIAKRWTRAYEKIITDSRINVTQQLIALFSRLKNKPSVFISGSAIGYYGSQKENELTENSSAMNSFSHALCAAWEAEANKANALGIRACLLRTGIVLGTNGGALSQMRLPFMLGLGGPFGDGEQWMSWIHMVDMIRLIHFCIEHDQASGAINATAPFPVTNKTFVKTYAKVLNRPCFMAMPSWVIRFLYGQMGEELLLNGQKVLPEKATTLGFSFIYPTLEMALLAISHEK